MIETLSWSRVDARLRTETPWMLSMGGKRGIRIGFEPRLGRLFLRIPTDADGPVISSPFTELQMGYSADDSGVVLEVSTVSESYYREFHRFATLLTENAEAGDRSAADALGMAIKGWRGLLAQRTILTTDQQLGLLAELLFLSALINRMGAPAVKAWIAVGPDGSVRHDFRLEAVDVEVKATRNTVRRHFIHGLEQLIPSAGRRLYVLSVRLEPSGTAIGRSLSSQVGLIRKQLSSTAARDDLESKLLRSNFRDADASFYMEACVLADQPRLIPVNRKVPVISRELLRRELPTDVMTRLDRVSYEVNFEGLGSMAGSEQYRRVLKNVELETA